jgi:exosortase A-associated hydrolase 2
LAITRSAFFLETPHGKRFCISTGPTGSPSGAVLFFPPFAEEVNKTRRMVALTVQALAERGWLVLQIDPGGCGDSEGDFGDVTWRSLLEDLGIGWRWLADRSPGRRVLWTLRAGCLSAFDWLRECEHQPDLLLWQPVFDGSQHLNQFLRLELARLMLAEADTRAVMAQLREQLDHDEPVEIAGYRLSPALARGLAAACFEAPPGYAGRIDMIEVGREAGSVSPALVARQKMLAASGAQVNACRVEGAAFWQTQGIEVAPALIKKTLDILGDMRS